MKQKICLNNLLSMISLDSMLQNNLYAMLCTSDPTNATLNKINSLFQNTKTHFLNYFTYE